MKTIEFNPLYCKNIAVGDVIICSYGTEFFLIISAKKTKNYYDIWYIKYNDPMVYKSSTNGIFTPGFNTVIRK